MQIMLVEPLLEDSGGCAAAHGHVSNLYFRHFQIYDINVAWKICSPQVFESAAATVLRRPLALLLMNSQLHAFPIRMYVMYVLDAYYVFLGLQRRGIEKGLGPG